MSENSESQARKNRPLKVTIEERRERVMAAAIQGMTPRQIFDQLKADYHNLTPKTIENDLAIVSTKIAARVNDLDMDAELGKTLACYDEIAREAWAAHDAAKRNKDRSAALKVVLAVTEARVRLLERIGLLGPAKPPEMPPTWEVLIMRIRHSRGLAPDGPQESKNQPGVLS